MMQECSGGKLKDNRSYGNMSKNMDLWNRAFKTDPNRVKKITGKDYGGSSPSPYYIVQRLTEEFGVCGEGWGVQIVSERMERLGPDDVLHIAHVRLWFKREGLQRGEIEQLGQTKACYRTRGENGYLKVDEDAPKKSVTDALVKCASYLGFAGDIFSGRWDDSKYVQELQKEFSGNRERTEWLARQKALIFGAANVGELKRVVSSAISIAMTEEDGSAVDQINVWADEKRAQAKPKTAQTKDKEDFERPNGEPAQYVNDNDFADYQGP